MHQNKRSQHRQRQNQGHRQCGAQIAEQHDQHQQHQHHGLAECYLHRIHGLVNQLGAIIKRNNGYALGQGRGECRQLALHAFHRAAAVGAFAQQHQAGHRFALAVRRHRAVAGERTYPHPRHILDADGCAAARGDGKVGYIRRITQLPHGAYQQHFLLAVDAVAARVAVVFYQRVFNVVQIQTLRRELRRVGDHLEGAHFSAQRVHVGSPIHRAQTRAYCPVL